MALRETIDQRLPAVARTYRWGRDAMVRAFPGHWDTPFGFRLRGRMGANMAPDWPSTSDGKAFLTALGAADALVDIGANIGVFTILAARMGKVVVAVEPDRDNLALLRSNLRALGAGSSVTIAPFALSDTRGERMLHGGGQGASLTTGWGGINSTYERPVMTERLDDLLAGRFGGDQLLIKLDVEGHEFSVLQGATATLRRDVRPVWYVEHGLTTNFGDQMNPHFEDLFTLFWDSGYQAFPSGGPQPVGADDVRSWIKRGEQGAVPSLNFIFR